jgi:hypothetical protein
MSYSNEEKQASIRRARKLLEELDARTPYEPAVEGAIEATPAEESGQNRNDRLIRYGLRLSDPHALEKYRAEAKETERVHWREWIMQQEHRLEIEKWLRERILADAQICFRNRRQVLRPYDRAALRQDPGAARRVCRAARAIARRAQHATRTCLQVWRGSRPAGAPAAEKSDAA